MVWRQLCASRNVVGLGTARGGAARVPDAAQQFLQRDLAGVLELHGGAAGEQGGARLVGHRGAGVVVQEARAGLRQPVDIRRAHLPCCRSSPASRRAGRPPGSAGYWACSPERLFGGERGQCKAAEEKMTAR